MTEIEDRCIPESWTGFRFDTNTQSVKSVSLQPHMVNLYDVAEKIIKP
eukprot:gene19209-27212_t